MVPTGHGHSLAMAAAAKGALVSSRWTHAICEMCWIKRAGSRAAHRLERPELERCCGCGFATMSGIYQRADPESMWCGGYHALAGDQAD